MQPTELERSAGGIKVLSIQPAPQSNLSPFEFLGASIRLLRTRNGAHWEPVPIVAMAGGDRGELAAHEPLRVMLVDPSGRTPVPWAGVHVTVTLEPLDAPAGSPVLAQLGPDGMCDRMIGFAAPPSGEARLRVEWANVAAAANPAPIRLRFAGPPAPTERTGGDWTQPREAPADGLLAKRRRSDAEPSPAPTATASPPTAASSPPTAGASPASPGSPPGVSPPVASPTRPADPVSEFADVLAESIAGLYLGPRDLLPPVAAPPAELLESSEVDGEIAPAAAAQLGARPVPIAPARPLVPPEDVLIIDSRRGAMAPPYVHNCEADRDEVVASVQQAVRAVRACAEGEPEARRVAALRLATLLSNPRVLDTPLLSTLAGRESFERALRSLHRATRSVALAESVVRSLQSAIAAAPDTRLPLPDAAALIAHICNLCTALGVEPQRSTPDLMLAPMHLFQLLARKAVALAAPFLSEAPELHGEALFLAACFAFIGHQADDAAALLFECWSHLLKHGLSPSRLEARVLNLLVHVHSLVNKVELAGHFLDRAYWYGETEEDRLLEVDVLHAHIICENVRKRHDAVIAASERSLERLRLMECPPKIRVFRSMISRFFGLVSSMRLRAAARYFKEMNAYAKEHDIMGHPDFDPVNFARVWWGKFGLVGPRKTLQFIKVLIFLVKRLDPRDETPWRAHMCWATGDGFLRTGSHRNAAAALEICIELYGKFPHLFPPDGERLRRAREGLRRARAGLDAEPLWEFPAEYTIVHPLSAAAEAAIEEGEAGADASCNVN